MNFPVESAKPFLERLYQMLDRDIILTLGGLSNRYLFSVKICLEFILLFDTGMYDVVTVRYILENSRDRDINERSNHDYDRWGKLKSH
jgi:uracil-DNA glycosylase